MTNIEREEYLNQFWKPFNSLFIDVIDDYEINTLTKVVRNKITGNICGWLDTGNATIGRRVELLKSNGKTSSYSENKVRKQCRLIHGL